MIKSIAMVAALLIITGCAKAEPKYSHKADKPTPNYSYYADQADPRLIFDAEFDLLIMPIYGTKTAYFYVNIEGSNSCEDFKLAGYILITESVIFDEPPNGKAFEIQVPADRMVTVSAGHRYNTGSYIEACGPLYMSFTPKKGKTYRVNIDKDGWRNRCELNIIDAATGSSVKNKVTGSLGLQLSQNSIDLCQWPAHGE